MSKEKKNIQLGSLSKKPQGNFFNFDNSIKKITIEREINGVTEVVTVVKNDAGYLDGGFVNKADENIRFRLDKDWISEEVAQKLLDFNERNGVKSVVSIKVQS